MDEEQGLVSPIASGIRGIRRSVSSNIFGARRAPVAQPDPQTTSLLQQNSLALNNLSRNLRTVSVQVSSLNSSLNIIKDNLYALDVDDEDKFLDEVYDLGDKNILNAGPKIPKKNI